MKPLAHALLGLAALAFFQAREAVFGGGAFYTRDLHLQWYGQVESFVRTLHAGSLPLWDPWVSFGQPMLANANAQVLYPPTWLNLLMRPWTYYTVYFLAHLLLAGLGTWSLARRFGASSSGALLAAAVWTSSGPLLSLGNVWNHLAGAAWLPWTLDATLRALDAPTPRRALAWGATLAAAVLAGSPDFAVLSGLFSVALVGTRLAAAAGTQDRVRRLGTATTALLFAFGLSAAQALPSAELASRSGRWSQSIEERTYWSLHPASLAQTVVPVSWDELPLTPSWSQALFEGREPYLLSVFVGLPVLVLACVALDRRIGRDELLLGGGLVAAVALALGRHAPFYSVAAALFPPLQLVRFPSKVIVVAAFTLALLAGLGYDALRSMPSRPAPRLARALALLLALAALVGAAELVGRPAEAALRPLRDGLLATALSGLVCFGLLAIGPRRPAAAGGLALLAVLPAAWQHRSLNPTAPVRLFTAHPDVLDALDQVDGRRLFVHDYLAMPGQSRARLGRDVPYLVPGVPQAAPWLQALGQRLYLLPPVGAAFGVRASFGRDLLGIQPTPLATLNSLVLRSDGTTEFARALRLGAVSQVLALHEEGSDFVIDRRFRGPFLDDMRLYRLHQSVPRALAVSGARVSERPFETLVDPGFDPSREVLLSDGPRAPVAGFRGSARIVEDRPDRMRIETATSAAAWLVVVDTYDPGWRATIDGRPASVVAANVAFRALAVPAGSHAVELRYRPASVLWGVGLSLATALLSVVLLLRMP